MHNIVVIGSQGLLGQAILRRAATRSLLGDVVGVDRPDIDITSAQSVADLIERERPRAIINCAAWTDVEACETPEGIGPATAVNADGVRVLTEACHRTKIVFIQISTDYVFNGTPREGVNEETIPGDPMNAYGRTKRQGEERMIMAWGGLNGSHFNEQDPPAYLVRTSWLFGPGAKNFVQKITDRARESHALNVVSDEIGSPTLADDLADRLLDLIETRPIGGIYHITGHGSCSRFAFAERLLKAQGIQATLKPCLLSDFARKAHIAPVSVLQNTKLPPLPEWSDMVDRYAASLK